MASKRHKPEEIVQKLRQVDVLVGQAVLCHDGAEAVATWKPGAFDCLLMDISMPRLSGIEALHEIRKQARTEAPERRRPRPLRSPAIPCRIRLKRC